VTTWREAFSTIWKRSFEAASFFLAEAYLSGDKMGSCGDKSFKEEAGVSRAGRMQRSLEERKLLPIGGLLAPVLVVGRELA